MEINDLLDYLNVKYNVELIDGITVYKDDSNKIVAISPSENAVSIACKHKLFGQFEYGFYDFFNRDSMLDVATVNRISEVTGDITHIGLSETEELNFITYKYNSDLKTTNNPLYDRNNHKFNMKAILDVSIIPSNESTIKLVLNDNKIDVCKNVNSKGFITAVKTNDNIEDYLNNVTATTPVLIRTRRR